ncbi:MAG TPA: hypothetical protein VHU40_03380 [Polyangia bacterium]|nr:hypothetical protein [Polyangia bacterium]
MADPAAAYWSGMLGEFRNHLKIFLAGTTELSASLPGSVAAQVSDRLEDMEASVEFLQTLLVWMDTSISGGAQVISDVMEVFRRTDNLVRPALPSRVNVRFQPSATGIRNRGAALECALAALITELSRLPPAWPPHTFSDRGRVDIAVSVVPNRGTPTIQIEGNVQLAANSNGWRVALARVLLGQIGGTLEPLTGLESGRAGFSVRFRLR